MATTEELMRYIQQLEEEQKRRVPSPNRDAVMAESAQNYGQANPRGAEGFMHSLMGSSPELGMQAKAAENFANIINTSRETAGYGKNLSAQQPFWNSLLEQGRIQNDLQNQLMRSKIAESRRSGRGISSDGKPSGGMMMDSSQMRAGSGGGINLSNDMIRPDNGGILSKMQEEELKRSQMQTKMMQNKMESNPMNTLLWLLRRLGYKVN